MIEPLRVVRIGHSLAVRIRRPLVDAWSLAAGDALELSGETLRRAGDGLGHRLKVVRNGNALALRLPRPMAALWAIEEGDALVLVGERLYVDTRAGARARTALAAHQGRFAQAMEALGDG